MTAPAARTHCPSAHPYAGINLLIDSRGRRRCRVCVRATARRSHQRIYQPDPQHVARHAERVARLEVATLAAAGSRV